MKYIYVIIYTFMSVLPEDFYPGRIGVAKCKKTKELDLLEKWQILGLSFMMMSKTPEDFHNLVKQEFGYIWDGKGWIKEVQYQ